ncbi:MAG: hypothetical protein HYW88_00185 [Candidatus Sungbacteria bacterium]|nr:hypothetical protein [Candidatus Sungbacteria bacterium]
MLLAFALPRWKLAEATCVGLIFTLFDCFNFHPGLGGLFGKPLAIEPSFLIFATILMLWLGSCSADGMRILYQLGAKYLHRFVPPKSQ